MDEKQAKIVVEVDGDQFHEGEETEVFRVLSFYLKDELYAIDIISAKEVVRPAAITRVPNVPKFVVGVMNLRGEIVPIFDIRSFFGVEQEKKSEGKRIIITDISGSLLGICVDKIFGTYDVSADDVQPHLSTIKGVVAEYTKGQIKRGEDIVVFLDLKKVLNCEEIRRLKQGGNQ